MVKDTCNTGDLNGKDLECSKKTVPTALVCVDLRRGGKVEYFFTLTSQYDGREMTRFRYSTNHNIIVFHADHAEFPQHRF